MNIRPAIDTDIPHIVEMERACATTAHWTQKQYEEAIHPGVTAKRLCLVAQSGPASASEITGFLVARLVEHEWELENVTVAPTSRRTGLGKRLLESLLSEVRETNGTSVFLEVRESNTSARGLYEKMGFEQTGRRRAYYSNPQEDAVLYQWNKCAEVHS